ncbi:tail fiber adhesin [Escherichia phage EcS1]|uniref:Distal long tail fiber assembly catalyst n=1 Tax=Escherichia phage EcS1 TaxID=2083276 RepID=A0A2Z5ZCE2_9CAUD|nr:tail fiber adhesin [Escherichia phage EcS1]BBC78319.1 Distal long tail fiber assembly catalyst [Escherichia phage EcS1]
MAVTGPWIGSSAVAETGQRWLINAATALRLGTPFWASSLSGRSRSFFITVGQYTAYAILAGEPDYRGAGGVMYNNKNTSLQNSPFGALDANGIWGGATRIEVVRSRVSTFGQIIGNLEQRNLILNIGGTNFQFNYTNGYWECTDPNGLYDFLGARIGWRLECIPQN